MGNAGLTPSQASSQIERWLDRAPAIAGLLLDLVDEIETFIDSDEIIIKFISDDLSEDEVTFLDSYFKSNEFRNSIRVFSRDAKWRNRKLKGDAVVLNTETGVTACGQRFDAADVFAAHYEIPCGTEIKATSATNGPIDIKVLERAGSSEKWDEIVLGLSRAAAENLNIEGRGWVRVELGRTP